MYQQGRLTHFASFSSKRYLTAALNARARSTSYTLHYSTSSTKRITQACVFTPLAVKQPRKKHRIAATTYRKATRQKSTKHTKRYDVTDIDFET